ncbi:hypothetical protein BJY04DRAFT_229278 [Aspergillus karnatakaensis]|uniref:uncharacterized protein n=1 Tax=Aspergillus karnatakaensis TaxID=1810916 RepID=UPI003CCCBDBC
MARSGKADNSKATSKPPVITWRFGAAPSKQTKKPSERETIASIETEQPSTLQFFSQSEICEITTSLDPFCNLPYLLSSEDQYLLHSYLVEVPARVYGTRPDAIFSPVRDVSFPNALTFSLTMRWMLIAASALYANTSMTIGGMTLANRKHDAYQRLNEAIDLSDGIVTDEVLGGIIMATMTEARLADPTAAKAHLQGYEAAIRARGGIRASLIACGLPALRITHLLPYLFSQPMPTSEHGDAQHLNKFLLLLLSQGISQSSNALSPGIPQLLEPALSYTPLAFFLQSDDTHLQSFADEASSFLALFLMTLVLSRIRNSSTDPQVFTARLVTILETSCAFDPQGVPLLTDQGFMWTVIRAIQDSESSFTELNEDNGLWMILHAINALRIFRTMSMRETRMQARLLLLYILSGQDLSWDLT